MTNKQKTMTDKQHIKQQVSDCFNASMSNGFQSAYVRLAKLLKHEFHLTQSDIEELVDEMEELIALYVLQTSPKHINFTCFNTDMPPAPDPLDEWDRKYEEKAGK